ncbi:MAG TPA: isoaspartyl peptidase/L-asparaginase, partial [Agriterribacter sp.]|nr:isoaspartyl peptidase/L-asparaginase [Agriterribacter sp.]
MATRRKFLHTSVLGSAAVLTGKGGLANAITSPRPTVNKPVVISTWDFGKAANAGAWNILGKGGRALDAVEAGVRIPEADPANRSIGYGGLPDRDGHVTLD